MCVCDGECGRSGVDGGAGGACVRARGRAGGRGVCVGAVSGRRVAIRVALVAGMEGLRACRCEEDEGSGGEEGEFGVHGWKREGDFTGGGSTGER